MLDVGYQLSVLGMCALVAAGSLWRRHFANRIDGWKGRVSRELLTSLVACAVTAPLVAWMFGSAQPHRAPIQPDRRADRDARSTRSVSGAPARAGRTTRTFLRPGRPPASAAFDWIASTAASVPGAAITVTTTLPTALLGALAAAALVFACVSRFPSRPAIAGVAALAGNGDLPGDPARPGRRRRAARPGRGAG